jgi:hypothetical protein
MSCAILFPFYKARHEFHEFALIFRKTTDDTDDTDESHKHNPGQVLGQYNTDVILSEAKNL